MTLIQHEHLTQIAANCGRLLVTPDLLRRNLAVSGIDLQSLKGRRFSIGEVLLEGTDDCPPCIRMEENLGPGGRKAMTGRGGITARVIEGGRIRTGDIVRYQ